MQGIHLFTIKGIPVSFQPMFILLILILSVGMNNPFIFGACATLGVLIHEFGHALTAKHFHLNPEVTLCGLGGLTTHARPNSPKQDFLITLADMFRPRRRWRYLWHPIPCQSLGICASPRQIPTLEDIPLLYDVH